MDIHSQHQTYTYLQPKTHINLLDNFGDNKHSQKISDYKSLFIHLKDEYDNLQALYKPKQGQTPILREIDWKRGVNGGPHTWVAEDLEHLLQSPNLFARKFSSKDMGFIESLVLRISQQTIHQ